MGGGLPLRTREGRGGGILLLERRAGGSRSCGVVLCEGGDCGRVWILWYSGNM